MAALGVLLGMSGAAEARQVPLQDHASLQYPGAPRPVEQEANSPYPMTYTDEVARSLGVKNGHMDFFSVQPGPSYLPSISAGVDRDGAMLRMRWLPGN
jgi:hypothetical protein